MRMKFILLLALASGCIPMTGCQHVKPWQRGALADPIMSAALDPVGTQQAEHVFFSREAASGGRGVGGGGCGCN